MATTIQDAKITVSLDTEGAKQELSQLKKSLAIDASKIRVNKILQQKQVQFQKKTEKTAMGKASKFAQRFGYKGFAVPDLFRGAVETVATVAGMLPRFVPIFGPPAGAILKGAIKVGAPWAEFGMPFMMGMARGVLEDPESKKKLNKYYDDEEAEEDRGSASSDVWAALNKLTASLSELKIQQANLGQTFSTMADATKTELAVGITPDWKFLGNLMQWEFEKADLQNRLRMKINHTTKNQMGIHLGAQMRGMIPRRGG